jgi:hypothetical protein
MAEKATNANMANKPIMPNKANMAKMPSIADATSTANMPTGVNRPVIPNKANKANIAQKSNLADIPNKLDDLKLPLPKRQTNQHNYRRPHFKTKPRWKQAYAKAQAKVDQDHAEAEREQCRQVRALVWWQGWHLLQDATHEVEVRTAWQTDPPEIQNTACLHAA